MTRGSNDADERVRWIPKKNSPWGVPVLDVRPFTHHQISTSADPAQPDNVFELQGDDGRRFIGAAPEVEREVACELVYPLDGPLADGVLFAPSAMEHKWGLFLHEGEITAVRSWTHGVCLVATVETDERRAVVTKIRGVAGEENEDPAWTIRTFDYLMQSHALRLVVPAPLPPGMGDDPAEAALWCFHLYGSMADAASKVAPPDRTPSVPLRTRSLLHIAAARGDAAAVRGLLADGLPVDLRGPGDITPLHWAAAAGNLAAVEALLEAGADASLEVEEMTARAIAEEEGHAEIAAVLDASSGA